MDTSIDATGKRSSSWIAGTRTTDRAGRSRGISSGTRTTQYPPFQRKTVLALLALLLAWSGLALASPARATEVLESVHLEALEGDAYSHFEIFLEVEEPEVERTLDDPLSMMGLTVLGFHHDGEIETFEIKTEFWESVKGVMDAAGAEWLTEQQKNYSDGGGSGGESGGGPGGGSGSGPGGGGGFGSGNDPDPDRLSRAIANFISRTDPNFQNHGALLGSLHGALQENEFAPLAAAPAGKTGCNGAYTAYRYGIIAAIVEHYSALLPAIIMSKTTCSFPVPDPFTKSACAVQLSFWAGASVELYEVLDSGHETKSKLDKVVAESAQDGIGVQINASQAHARSIARNSKLSELRANQTYAHMRIVMYLVGGATYYGGPGVWAAGGVELTTLALAMALFSEYHDCQIRVVAPRFEANAIRARAYLDTPNGWEHWVPPGHAENMTAMSREVARESVVEIDAEKLFRESPWKFPVFDERTQSQLLELRICEGVVVPRDPGTLAWPFHQMANTPYLLESSAFTTEEFPFFGSWPAFIGERYTVIPAPFAGATIHRACEDGFRGEMIDNDNNGIPESNVKDRCGHDPRRGPDPAGQVEEDVYLHPAMGSVAGETNWKSDGEDMSCTGVVLELASKHGLTGRPVQTETVLDVASYWTNASDGSAANAYQHPQDSTQIRFRLVDDNWGHPRPRVCYERNRWTSRWVCDKENLDCPCEGAGGGAPGM